MSLKIKSYWTVCMMDVLLSGCTCNSYYNNRHEDVDDAEKVTNNFYALLTLDQPKQIYPLLSHHFIQATNIDTLKFVALLKQFDDKLGKVDSYHIRNWQTNVVKGTNPRATYVLSYDVRRGKNTAVETFNLEKENGNVKISGYHVESIGFVTDSSNVQSTK